MDTPTRLTGKRRLAAAHAFRSNVRLATTLALLSLLAACATGPYTYNEGSVRAIRYTNNNTSGGMGLYLPPALEAPGSVIARGEAISIRLVSAFICDFRESASIGDLVARGNAGAAPCPGGDGGQHPGTRGEIAIVASIGERNGAGGLTFDPAAIRNGRVVYYDEDVRETGQLINAINLPVYGPKTYDGRPFYIDLAVLELDNKENAAARKLLQQLAEIGTLSAAPQTPVLKLLNTLGSALVNANNDDLEMRFQLETDAYMACDKTTGTRADCSDSVVDRMPLRAGYYAFIRGENRSEFIDTTRLRVCSKLGSLCQEGKDEPWRDKSWLLVRVAREDSDAALAQDTAQDLAGLMDALNASVSTSASATSIDTTLQGISGAIKEIIDRQIARRKK